MIAGRGLRLAVWLVAALALAGCYKVRGTVVERNDEKIAATLVGQYYLFKDAPEPKDWSTLKDQWTSYFEIKRDAAGGQYQVLGRSSEGAATKTMTGRIAPLDQKTLVGQVAFPTGETFVLLLRRDASGILRTARGTDGSFPVAPQGGPDRVLPFLRLIAASERMVWSPLLVPRALVDGK